MGKIDFDKFLIDYVNSGFSKKRMAVNYLLEKQGLQIVKDKIVSAKDKKEPKFRNGQWIVWQNKCYKVNYNGCGYELVDQNGLSTSLGYGTIDENAHLWDIAKDAKVGDVLYTSSTASHEVFIFKGLTIEGYIECYCSYDSEDKYCEGEYHFIGKPTFMTHPATAKQYDLLFSKMKDAGYEWDADKNELKKIEQKLADKIEHKFKVGDVIRLKGGAAEYMIKRVTDATYYTEGWSCSIERCEEDYELVEQKQEWSEEDNLKMGILIHVITNQKSSAIFEGLLPKELVSWLISLKERVQPKVELTQLDKNILEAAIAFVEQNNHFNYWCGVNKRTVLSALHSIKSQNAWKPSDEQMEALRIARDRNDKIGFYLSQLYDDLKKLI